MRLTAIDLERSQLAPVGDAKTLHVQAGRLDLVLAPTAIEKALKALKSCEDDRLVTWGMDTAVVPSIATFPKAPGGLVSIFDASDYPITAVRKGEQGTAGVRYWVGTDGGITDCRVIESSGSEMLDRKTCGFLLKRARLEPAITHSGQDIPSVGFQRVRWELPWF